MSRAMRVVGFILLPGAVFLSGCEASPFDEGWSAEVVARSLASEVRAYRPGREPGEIVAGTESQAALAEPTGEITLRQAWSLALMHHPGLEADAWEVRASEARAMQAGASPNPEIQLRLDDFGGNGDSSDLEAAELRLRVTQVIELGGKRAKRIAVANAEKAVMAWDYEARRVALAATVTGRFVDVLAAQETLALAAEGIAFAEEMGRIVDERVQAKALLPVEKDRSAVRLGQARIAHREAQLGLDAARRQLAATWDSERPMFDRVAGKLETNAERAVPVDELLALLNEHPEVARWASEVAHRKADIELAKAEGVGDIQVGGGAKYFRGDSEHALLVELSIPLPLFDRNEGEILEKRFALAKANAEGKLARSEARVELLDAHRDAAMAQERAAALRANVVPKMTTNLDTTRGHFKEGLSKLDDMLDAHRDLLKARAEMLDSLAVYHRSAAIIEGLIGRPLDAVKPPERKE